jgi:hypothetical protein
LEFGYTGVSKFANSEFRALYPNMELKKKIGTSPTKIHWCEGALFQVRFLQIKAKSAVFTVIYGVDNCGK